MAKRWLEVPDVARRLGVHAKTVYVLIERDGLPAARVGKKFVVGEEELDLWIATRRTQAPPRPLPSPPPTPSDEPFTLGGGDSLLVESLLVTLRAERPEIAWQRSSVAGLAALVPVASRDDLAALVNLRAPGGEELVPEARLALGAREPRVLPFLERPIGVALSEKARAEVRVPADLARLRIALREEGAGARVVAERLLAEVAPRGTWRARAIVAPSHHAVAWMVATGKADAGFCAPAVARTLDLAFLRLGWEAVDCVLSRTAAESIAGRALARVLGRRALDPAWSRAGYRRPERPSRPRRRG